MEYSESRQKMRDIVDTADMADVENNSANTNHNTTPTSLEAAANNATSMETSVGSMTNTNVDVAEDNALVAAPSSGTSSGVVINDSASETSSSAVTLETLSEDGSSSAVHTASIAASAAAAAAAAVSSGGHPLLTPTSPRSVTTASMSASGKPDHIISIPLSWRFYDISHVPNVKKCGSSASHEHVNIVFQNIASAVKIRIIIS